MKLKLKSVFTILLITILTLNLPICAYASEAEERLEAHRAIAAESDSIEGWPKAPAIGAGSACMIDTETGTILYSKKMDEVHFPASTTKIMTCLLAAENCDLDEIVTFSKEAVYGIDRDSSNVGMDVGQSITMEEALYCVLLASANEVASAVAEHVAGSIDDFAVMMNERAAQIGCTNTHFVNPNGLHDEEHYTTVYDMYLIFNEALKYNEFVALKKDFIYDCVTSSEHDFEFEYGSYPFNFSSSL